jgi:hypothetical protein
MIGNGAGQRAAENQRQAADDCSAKKEHDSAYGPPHPLGDITKRLREVIEYANQYVETRKDAMRSTIRGLMWKVALGVVAAVAGVTIIVVAAAYLMSGIAHGLGRLLWNENWLGELITGLGVFLILGCTAFLVVKSMTKKARERTIKKYERRQQHQREHFGQSATDRAQQLRQAHRE